jgi:hypothetical protein
VKCPNPDCNKVGVLDENAVGTNARCPKCGTAFPDASSQKPAKQTAPPTTVPQAAAHETITEAPARGAERPAAHAAAQRIGRFELRARLGAGAFGVVYRAFDPQLEREVALKVMHTKVLKRGHRVERFQREARAAAKLRHANIVPVFEVGRDGGQHYIAAAYVAGMSLDDALGDKPMKAKRAARIVCDLAEAVAYAHREGVVHRDLKPANVLLDENDAPQLVDFGLAVRPEPADGLAQAGAVVGTPSYMAPEQARGEADAAQPPADQYSLGVILYALLCGHPPFEGPPALVIFNVANNKPAPPRTLNPEVPPELERICLKAMAARPKDRYADCQAFAEALRGWFQGKGPPGQGRLAARRSLWLSWTILGTAACILVVAALTGVSVWRTAMKMIDDRRERDARALAEQKRQQDEEAAERKRKLDQEAEADAAALQKKLEAGAAAHKRKVEQDAADELAGLSKEARAAVDKYRRQKYQDNLQLVRRALDRDEHQTAFEVLRQQPQELRDDEWRLLAGKLVIPGKVFNAHAGGVNSVALAPNGKTLVSGGDPLRRDGFGFTGPGEIKLWDVTTGKQTGSFKDPDRWVYAVAAMPDGETVVSGSVGLNVGASVKLWEAATGKDRELFRISEATSSGLALTADGKTLAWGGGAFEGIILLWDVGKRKQRDILRGHKGAVNAVAFTADGKTLASGGADNTVKLWDVATGKNLATLRGHAGLLGVQGVAFTPDGKTLASGGDDGTLKLWDVATAAERLALPGHTGAVKALAFTPDGRTLASGGDSVIKLWDVTTGKERATLRGHTNVVTAVAFTADGKTLASGSADGTVRLWDLAPKLD